MHELAPVPANNLLPRCTVWQAPESEADGLSYGQRFCAGAFSSAIEAGANKVQGLEFLTTELRKYRDQARSMAIKAAQEKAAAFLDRFFQFFFPVFTQLKLLFVKPD